MLLEAGAALDAKSNKGHTALHRASRRGQKEIVEMLLQGGADVNAKSKWSLTALDVAINERYDEIVKLLRKHGGVSIADK